MIQRAVLYVAAMGLYEVHINGQRVGDHVPVKNLSPTIAFSNAGREHAHPTSKTRQISRSPPSVGYAVKYGCPWRTPPPISPLGKRSTTSGLTSMTPCGRSCGKLTASVRKSIHDAVPVNEWAATFCSLGQHRFKFRVSRVFPPSETQNPDMIGEVSEGSCRLSSYVRLGQRKTQGNHITLGKNREMCYKNNIAPLEFKSWQGGFIPEALPEGNEPVAGLGFFASPDRACIC
jgi:hypothetical protein